MSVLNSSNRRRLLALLENLPEMASERSRRQLLVVAGLEAIAKRIDMSGSPALTAGEMVEILSGDRASFASFLSVVRELVGAEQQEFLDRVRSQMPTPSADTNGEDVDALVREVRRKLEPDIRQRCGTIKVLDMMQPVGLGQIYTDVNILKEITARQRMKLKELQVLCGVEEFDRLRFGAIERKRVPGLKAANNHTKLTIWGKPGAGKTTFMKYLAMQCLSGEFQGDRVPVFVTLKDFAEAEGRPKLLQYIEARFADWEIATGVAEELLDAKRILLLLDGLDEVRQQDSKHVINEIQQFTNRYGSIVDEDEIRRFASYYSKNIIDEDTIQIGEDEIQQFLNRYEGNRITVTCRIAAREYTFQGFTEVEMADFDYEQVQVFVSNWFAAKNDNLKTEHFLARLRESAPIRELTTNPLLLTLLCLVFGTTNNFPANRWELYEEGIDVLLKKWDANRNIERDHIYHQLSPKRKEYLLAQVARTTFDRGEYFFKQRDVECYIKQYIANLTGAKDAPEALQLDSESVLKSIEAQHGLLVERAKGIYSFSHLTFQEYFTASCIVQEGDLALRELARHVTEPRWREIFFMVVGMLPNATDFAIWMKEEIDGIVSKDEGIQEPLTWLHEKFGDDQTIWPEEARQQFAALLGFSFSSDKAYTLFLSLPLYLSLDLSPDLSLYLSLSLDTSLSLDLYLSFSLSLNISFDKILSKAIALAEQEDPELYRILRQMQARLPEREDKDAYKAGCKKPREAWGEELRAATLRYRNIGRKWQFSKGQQKRLETYWNAYRLLFQCLSTDCHIDRTARQHIENTLFIPTTPTPLPAEKSDRTNSRPWLDAKLGRHPRRK